jgi:hypothetical protein
VGNEIILGSDIVTTIPLLYEHGNMQKKQYVSVLDWLAYFYIIASEYDVSCSLKPIPNPSSVMSP